MADPVWPATVPHKLIRDDFQGAQPSMPPLETPMEGGHTRMRPGATAVVATMQGSIYMTDAQFEAFKTFHRDTLLQGTREFTMPIFGTSTYSDKKCQLVGATYKWARYGVGWKITLALRVWDW